MSYNTNKYNNDNRYEKNYNYVQNKINKMSQNFNLEFKDILEDLVDNRFTQSIEYDFNNNDRTLIKQNIQTSANIKLNNNNINTVNNINNSEYLES